ncbi:MAG: type III polyketide synthase [Azospirillaceae bacterium]
MVLPTPRLLSIATAVPPHRVDQATAREAARESFGDRAAAFDRLAPVFDNAGIRTRHVAAPLDWYRASHGWTDKNALYLDVAPALLAEAAGRALADAGLEGRDVDTVVTVGSTGIATPGLESRLIGPLGLRPEVGRVPLFGLGCAGGVLGLGHAAALARAAPGSTVLLLAVELCSLAFRPDDTGKASIVATALFADGAAAAVIRAGDGKGTPSRCLAGVPAWGEHTWLGTLDVMGWRVEDAGLGVVFARSIPDLVRERLAAAADGFLARNGLGRRDLAGIIAHPGGTKVLDALAAAFDLDPGALAVERSVLARYGNMSSVTVLFVLAERLAAGARGRHLMTALGPGFTAGFALLEA